MPSASDRARGQVNEERNAATAAAARADNAEARAAAREAKADQRASVIEANKETAAAKPAATTTTTPAASATTPIVAPQVANVPIESTAGAADQMAGYDQYTRQALGGTPAESMALARAAAAQEAQAGSDAAIRQAVKGAKTAGAMGGQAALAATGTAADAYGTAQQAAQQQYFDLSKLGATLGSEMSNRLAGAESLKAQQAQAQLQSDLTTQALQQQGELTREQIAANKAAQDAATKQQTIGNVIGTVGGIAALFSDERLKEDIEPDSLTDGLEALRSYRYKYKGNPRQEAGVMAQELEQTPMASAVIDTPEGKMLDTRRLTSMNTAGLAEHEKRLKDIERLVAALGEIERRS